MKIYKDEHEIDVSPDAYKMMYKRLGYQVLKNKSKTKKDIFEKQEEKEEVETIKAKNTKSK